VKTTEALVCETCGCAYDCGTYPSPCPYCENEKLRKEIERLKQGQKKVRAELNRWRNKMTGRENEESHEFDCITVIAAKYREQVERLRIIVRRVATQAEAHRDASGEFEFIDYYAIPPQVFREATQAVANKTEQDNQS